MRSFSPLGVNPTPVTTSPYVVNERENINPVPPSTGYLLQEDGFFLLQEDGFLIEITGP